MSGYSTRLAAEGPSPSQATSRLDVRQQQAAYNLEELVPGLHRCEEWLAAAIRENSTGPLLLCGHTPAANTAVASALADAYSRQTVWTAAFTSEICYGIENRNAEREGGQRAASGHRDAFASARLLVVDGMGMSTLRQDLDLVGVLLEARELLGLINRTIITTHYYPRAFGAFGDFIAELLCAGATMVDVPAQPFRSVS